MSKLATTIAPNLSPFAPTRDAGHQAPFAAVEARFFTRLRTRGYAPHCIYDVGACTGAWSLAIREVFPAALFEMFEPLATVRDEYAKALAWATQVHPTFHLHAIALGSTSGDADFWHTDDGCGSSLLADHIAPQRRIKVPVRRLDDWVAQHALPTPQVIKVDVQGGELQVLQGATQTIAHADILHLETWLARGYGKKTPLLPELMDFLKPHEHVLVQLGEYWRRDDQELVVVDAFFAHRRFIDHLSQTTLASGHSLPWPQNWPHNQVEG